MQQKIKIFAEKGVPAQKNQKRTSLPPPKVNPRCPLQGTGIRAAGRPPYRRASEPEVRFGGSAAGPAARPRPPHNPSALARRGKCEGGTIAVPPSRSIGAGAFKSAKRHVLPPAPKKNAPGLNAPTRPTGGKDSVKENRQGCLSRLIRAGAFKSAKRYALPPAPAKKTPKGVFFAGAADGN